MFRRGPQAFIAVGKDSPPGLREAIRLTLGEHDVEAISLDRSTASDLSLNVQRVLRDSDFVIADITNADPNVMFEVGMAQGMGKRLLLLSEKRSDALPFDLAAQQVAVYRPDDVDSVSKYLDFWLRDAKSELESADSEASSR